MASTRTIKVKGHKYIQIVTSERSDEWEYPHVKVLEHIGPADKVGAGEIADAYEKIGEEPNKGDLTPEQEPLMEFNPLERWGEEQEEIFSEWSKENLFRGVKPERVVNDVNRKVINIEDKEDYEEFSNWWTSILTSSKGEQWEKIKDMLEDKHRINKTNPTSSEIYYKLTDSDPVLYENDKVTLKTHTGKSHAEFIKNPEKKKYDLYGIDSIEEVEDEEERKTRKRRDYERGLSILKDVMDFVEEETEKDDLTFSIGLQPISIAGDKSARIGMPPADRISSYLTYDEDVKEELERLSEEEDIDDQLLWAFDTLHEFGHIEKGYGHSKEKETDQYGLKKLKEYLKDRGYLNERGTMDIDRVLKEKAEPELEKMHKKTEETGREQGLVMVKEKNKYKKYKSEGTTDSIDQYNKDIDTEKIDSKIEIHTHPSGNIGFSKKDWESIITKMLQHPEGEKNTDRAYGTLGKRLGDESPTLHVVKAKNKVDELSVEEQRELITEARDKLEGYSSLSKNDVWDVLNPYIEEEYINIGNEEED